MTPRFPVGSHVRDEARRLAALPSGAGGRIAADLLAYVALAALGYAGGPVVTILVAFPIGFLVQHDLLIYGHEAVHRLVARRRWLDEAALVLIHALFGVSGTAHRRFHLAHHRWTHEDRDPEWWVLRRVGGTGLAYVALAFVAPLGVHLWTWRHVPRVRVRMLGDLAVAGVLHGALIALLGPFGWAAVVVLPMAVGLIPAFIVRSIAEHHTKASGDRLRDAGTLDTSPIVAFLWSNIHLHLEHHLFPDVPTRHLPALRAALRPTFASAGVIPNSGWIATWWRLVRQKEHFR